MAEVHSIHIAPSGEEPLVAVGEVRAVPGKGLEGDRYFFGAGTYSDKPGPNREVTLIESEAVEAIGRDYNIVVDYGVPRRNIVTRGIALNHLVGREFSVGDVRMLGIKLCEPCKHMETLAGKPGIQKSLLHRGGLNAQILSEGVIRPGDSIVAS